MSVVAESTRLGVLRRYQDLVQQEGPRAMSQVCRVAATLTGAEVAAVNLIDRDTAHRVAAEGVPLGQMSRSDALCDLVVRTGEAVVTADASADPRFAGLVVVDGPEPPVRFYASVPLVAPDGSVLGTLCSWDRRSLVPAADGLARLVDLSETVVDRLEFVRVTHDLAHVATHDPLTGLPNRALLRDRLGQALAARRTHVVVACLDLDGFRHVTARHGHEAADALVAQVGARLRCVVRPQDTLARVGPDEFVVVLADSGPITPDVLLARLLRAFTEPYRVGEGLERVRPSTGAVQAHPDDTVAGVLVRVERERLGDEQAHLLAGPPSGLRTGLADLLGQRA